MNPKINESLVTEILHLLSFGLTKGIGNPSPGQMCVEALITQALGEEFSDNPSCVGSEVRKCKIELNDCDWPSNEARAEGMKKLAIAQLGSDTLNQEEFRQKLKLNSTKKILPYIIQKHYEECKDEKLLEYKQKFEKLKKLDDNLWKEFYYNYNYYYNHYYYYYYYDYNDYNYNYYYGIDFLNLIADTILQTLIEMKSPGCKYLYLCK